MISVLMRFSSPFLNGSTHPPERQENNERSLDFFCLL